MTGMLCTLGYGLDAYGADPYGSPDVPLVLSVTNPMDGDTAPAGSHLFVTGSVTPGAMVWVNGESVTPTVTGAFAAWVFVVTGPNVVNVQAGCDAPVLTITRLVFGLSSEPVLLPDGGILSPGVYPLMEESA